MRKPYVYLFCCHFPFGVTSDLNPYEFSKLLNHFWLMRVFREKSSTKPWFESYLENHLEDWLHLYSNVNHLPEADNEFLFYSECVLDLLEDPSQVEAIVDGYSLSERPELIGSSPLIVLDRGALPAWIDDMCQTQGKNECFHSVDIPKMVNQVAIDFLMHNRDAETLLYLLKKKLGEELFLKNKIEDSHGDGHYLRLPFNLTEGTCTQDFHEETLAAFSKSYLSSDGSYLGVERKCVSNWRAHYPFYGRLDFPGDWQVEAYFEKPGEMVLRSARCQRVENDETDINLEDAA